MGLLHWTQPTTALRSQHRALIVSRFDFSNPPSCHVHTPFEPRMRKRPSGWVRSLSCLLWSIHRPFITSGTPELVLRLRKFKQRIVENKAGYLVTIGPSMPMVALWKKNR